MNTVPNHILFGNLTKNILKFAWPIIIALLLQTSFNIVDTIFIGRLGIDELAAVSLSFPIDYFMISLILGLAVGITSLIARKIGAGDKEGADNIAEHALAISFIIAGIFTFLGTIFGPVLYFFFSPNSNVAFLMKEYMSILFLGSVFLFFGITAMSILQGEGDTKTPMKALAVAVVINIILDPILIFGLFGLPALGVHGAAVATVAARGMGCLYLIWHLFIKGSSYVTFRFRHFKPRWRLIKNIFDIGLPSSLSQISSSLGLMGFNKLAAFLGPVAVASYGVGYKVDSLALLPVFGVSSVCITLVGMQIGAERTREAKKVISQAIMLVMRFIIPAALLIFLSAKYLMFIFTSNLEVVRIGAQYIRIIAFTYPFMSIVSLVAAGFVGAGRAGISLIINTLRVIILNLVFAFLLAFIFRVGIVGLWWGIVLASVFSAAIAWHWWQKAKLV